VCYDPSARPPVPVGPGTAQTIHFSLTSPDGTQFAATTAKPIGDANGGDSWNNDPPGSAVGVVVIPDNRGLRGFYDQLATRLAEHGHAALAIDYYGRIDGVSRDRGDDLPLMRYLGGLTADGIRDDIVAAADYLRAPTGGRCGAVVALGFCLGGRFAFLSTQRTWGLDGAIGFYGATGVINGAPGPTQLAAELNAPILGIFGGSDEHLEAAGVEEFDAALSRADLPHEIISYPGAPHGFFDVNYDDHAEACADAWKHTLGFLTDQRG
jgi:carboxymethylenebutenolidase